MENKERLLQQFKEALNGDGSVNEFMQENGSSDSTENLVINALTLNDMVCRMRSQGIPNIEIMRVRLESLDDDESKNVFLIMLNGMGKITQEEFVDLKERYSLL